MVIAFIGGYFFWIRFGSIISRDNMNYQTYDWYFDPTGAPTAGAVGEDPWGTEFGTCIGDGCCSTGLIYDSSLNQCVVPSASTATTTTTATPMIPTMITTTTEGFTESMVESILTKKDPNKQYKNDVALNSDSYVKPSTSNSFIYKN